MRSQSKPTASAVSRKTNQARRVLRLASSEEVYDCLLRTVRDGLLLVSAATGKIEASSQSLQQLLGRTKTELQGLKAWQVGFLAGPLVSATAFRRLKRGSAASYGQMRIRTRRGEIRDVDLRGAFCRIDDADMIQFSVRDITERLQLAETIKDKEDRYFRIFDNNQLGIVILDRDFRVTKINRAFSRITGYDELDMRRLTLGDITHPSHLAEHRQVLRGVRRCADGDYHVEIRYIGKDGKVIWANTHFGVVCDATGKPLYLQAIIEDITERREIEAHLAEQNRRNLEKEKLIQKLKDEFVFVAAHELRTPVTAISWAMELLGECRKNMPAVESKESVEALGIIDENAKRLNSLVAELLEVARIEHGSFKVVSQTVWLPEIIERAASSVRAPAAAKAVTIRIALPPGGLSPALGDPLRVQDVLVNLLTNAIKYNGKGGRVTVRVSEVDRLLWVRVEDDGLGLDPSDVARLFQKFSRIERADTQNIAGTGLGLFIVKQAVERMGGTVWVKSAGRGKGSVFAFSLPKGRGKRK